MNQLGFQLFSPLTWMRATLSLLVAVCSLMSEEVDAVPETEVYSLESFLKSQGLIGDMNRKETNYGRPLGQVDHSMYILEFAKDDAVPTRPVQGLRVELQKDDISPGGYRILEKYSTLDGMAIDGEFTPGELRGIFAALPKSMVGSDPRIKFISRKPLGAPDIEGVTWRVAIYALAFSDSDPSRRQWYYLENNDDEFAVTGWVKKMVVQ